MEKTVEIILDGKENEWILNQIEPLLSLRAQSIKLKSLLGHILKRTSSLEKTVMLRTAKGKGGRPATRWMETIRGIMNQPFRSLKTQTEDRIFWRNTIHMVARRQTSLEIISKYYSKNLKQINFKNILAWFMKTFHYWFINTNLNKKNMIG